MDSWTARTSGETALGPMLIGDSPLLISLVLSPLSLVVLAALYCSFWPTYRDAVRD